MNQATIPAAAHVMLPSRPQGAGWGAVRTAGSSLIVSLCGSACESSRVPRRGPLLPLACERNEVGRIPHRPLADAITAAPLGQVYVHVVFVEAVGGRAEHRGEARAGARLQPLAHLLGDCDVGQLVALAIGKRDRLDVDRISLAVLADLGADDAIAAAAFIRVEIGNTTERRAKCRGDRCNVIANPDRQRFGTSAAQDS